MIWLQRVRAERSASEETFFAILTSRSGDDKTLEDAMMDDGIKVDGHPVFLLKSYILARDIAFFPRT